MSVQLNNDTYAVKASKDGQTREFHGVKDTRWHSVERANSLHTAGWTILDITADGKSDVDAHQALLNRHSVLSEYAKMHKMEPTKSNGKAPAEKKQELPFEKQEELAAPLRDLGKLVTHINQSILKGSLPVDSVNLMAVQCMLTLKTLGIKPEVIQEQFKNYYSK